MGHIRAVERVDEGTFPQPHVMQVVAQDGTGQLRTTYIQCKVGTSTYQHQRDPNTLGCHCQGCTQQPACGGNGGSPGPKSCCTGNTVVSDFSSTGVTGVPALPVLGSVGYAAISVVGFTGLSVILGSLGYPVISVLGSLRYQHYIR